MLAVGGLGLAQRILLLAQGAPYVDLDAPLLLSEDRAVPMRVQGATLYPPDPALWG